MDGLVMAQWVATAIIAIGLGATWYRNGRNQAKQWGSLETEVKNIKESLDDENTGLGAIKKSVDEQKLHCTKISTNFKSRIERLEEESRGATEGRR